MISRFSGDNMKMRVEGRRERDLILLLNIIEFGRSAPLSRMRRVDCGAVANAGTRLVFAVVAMLVGLGCRRAKHTVVGNFWTIGSGPNSDATVMVAWSPMPRRTY